MPHAIAPMSVPAKRNNHKTNHRCDNSMTTCVHSQGLITLFSNRERIYRRLQKKETAENTLFNKYNGGSGLGNEFNI